MLWASTRPSASYNPSAVPPRAISSIRLPSSLVLAITSLSICTYFSVKGVSAPLIGISLLFLHDRGARNILARGKKQSRNNMVGAKAEHMPQRFAGIFATFMQSFHRNARLISHPLNCLREKNSSTTDLTSPIFFVDILRVPRGIHTNYLHQNGLRINQNDLMRMDSFISSAKYRMRQRYSNSNSNFVIYLCL